MASAAFLARMDSAAQEPVLLVQIDLLAYGGNPAQTLRLASRAFDDAAGNHWDDVILDTGALDIAGTFLGAHWQPPDFQLVVGDLRLSFQAADETLATLISGYRFHSSVAKVYLGDATLTNSADWGTLLIGEVNDVVGISATEISLHLVQSRRWITLFPPRVIEKSTFVDAPDDSIGQAVPILFGDFVTGRAILTNNEASPALAYLAGISRGGVPTIIVASGNDELTRYAVSDIVPTTEWELPQIVDPETGVLGGRSTSVSGASSGGGDPYYYLAFPSSAFQYFEYAIFGVAEQSSTTADNWWNAVRPLKDYTLADYAWLDHDAGKSVLRVDLPQPASKGALDTNRFFVYCWYAWNGVGSPPPRIGIKHPLGDVFTDLTAAAPATYPAASPNHRVSVNVSSRLVDWVNVPEADLYVETRAAGQTVQIFRICLVARYRPNLSIVSGGQPIYRAHVFEDYSSFFAGYGWRAVRVGTTEQETIFDPPLWVHQYGPADDGSGTYTGAASALIERPGDVVHYLLRAMAGLGANEVETAGSTHGSFVDLRTTLSGYKMIHYASRQRKIDEVLNAIGEQFLIWFFRKHTDPDQAWAAVPWNMGDAINYRSVASPFLFGPQHIEGSPVVRFTPLSQVRNTVRVNFDYDIRTRTYARQVYVTPTDSWGWTGSAYARDQNTTAPDNREAVADASADAYGAKEQVLNLDMVVDPATATNIRDRFFDLVNRPLALLRFMTGLNAADLERGMVIGLSTDWDAVMPCPVEGSSGSWSGQGFRVVRVARASGVASGYEVEAVEV